MAFPEPRRSQALLAAYLAAAFAISAAGDPRFLAALSLLALALFRRGAGRSLRKVLVSVVPFTAVLSLATWAWQRLAAGRGVDWPALAALNLRTSLIAFLTFSVMQRIDLFRALERSPSVSRLLVIALAQIHALRRLVTESLLGLRSRLTRVPGAGDVLRGAGAITATLFALSAKNSRDVADALRSRGL